MDILGQRDPRWADIKINGTNYTLGGYGCFITCVSMVAGITPDVAVKKLSFDGALLNWDSIKNIGLEPLEKTTWDNQKALDYITANGQCIARVDFDGSPRTDDTHFVVLIGNKRLYDPWTGTERPTSAYSIYTGIRACRKIEMDCLIPNTPEWQKKYQDIIGKASAYDAFRAAGYETPQVVKNIEDDYKKQIDAWKREAEADAQEAEARRQDFKLLVSSLAEILGTRQEAPEIINQAQLDAEKAGMLDDAEAAHKRDKELWAKNELALNSEIAKWKAIAEQKATLGDYESSMLIKELINRLTKALDLGRFK